MLIAIQNKEKSCSENPLCDTDFVQQLHRKLSFSNTLKILFETLHCNKQYLKVTSKRQSLNRIRSNLLLFNVPVHTDGSRGWDCTWGRVPTSDVDRSMFLFLLIGRKTSFLILWPNGSKKFPYSHTPKRFYKFHVFLPRVNDATPQAAGVDLQLFPQQDHMHRKASHTQSPPHLGALHTSSLKAGSLLHWPGPPTFSPGHHKLKGHFTNLVVKEN